MVTPNTRAPGLGRLRLALGLGAAVWLFLLVAGFVLPGGWVWAETGVNGHMDRFMIALWLVTLVIAPLIAYRNPISHRGAMDVYLHRRGCTLGRPGGLGLLR